MNWDDLASIHSDHDANRKKLENAAQYIVDSLRALPAVHSIRFRTKEPDHLVAKIIRKKLDFPDREYTKETYRTLVMDLVGIRALHLFKDEWLPIHEFVTSHWEHNGMRPTANIRRGDEDAQFKAHGCEIHEHKAGYRSVHYLIRSQPAKEVITTELQVRTLFEEGWSEIDHRIRYPHAADDAVLAGYLAMFNRLAGNADEMGSFVKRLQTRMDEQKQERDAVAAELASRVHDLEEAVSQLKIADKEKRSLEKKLKELSEKQRQHPGAISINMSNALEDATFMTILNPPRVSNLIFNVQGARHCNVCFAPLPDSTPEGEDKCLMHGGSLTLGRITGRIG